MLSHLAFTIASVILTLANAQSSTSSAANTTGTAAAGNSATGFNIALVSSTDKFNWCHAELNTCPEVCGGSTSSNSCDQDTLTFSCVCGNGTTPDVSKYEQSLPFYICQATFDQCINSHPNDAMGQQTCKDNKKCGTLNATSSSTTSSGGSSGSSGSSSSSTSGVAGTVTGSATATATASAATGTASGLASKMVGPEVGVGLFAGLFLTAFKLFL